MPIISKYVIDHHLSLLTCLQGVNPSSVRLFSTVRTRPWSAWLQLAAMRQLMLHVPWGTKVLRSGFAPVDREVSAPAWENFLLHAGLAMLVPEGAIMLHNPTGYQGYPAMRFVAWR